MKRSKYKYRLELNINKGSYFYKSGKNNRYEGQTKIDIQKKQREGQKIS